MGMTLDRRQFLAGLATLAPLTVAGRVWAAPKADARLLVVFLRGAYDAANVVIPVASDFYYESRPTLAIARPGSGETSALALDADWGLHPALRSTILPLFAKGQAAFVPFAGTDDLTRSHFETQDTIELGQEIGGRRDYRSGFMGRLAQELTRVRPIAFTEQLPLTFQGEVQVPNVAITSAGTKPGIDARQAQLIAAMYRDGPLEGTVADGFKVRDEVYQQVTEHMMEASRGAATPKGFELSARRIGRLMRDGFNLGFVDVGGWDTHVNQGAATGYLADRLAELGRGLAGFAEEIGPKWTDTVVVVLSEFGRTFRENGNRGTDHGHGSVYWVLGGNVRGGRIAGEQVTVNRDHLFQNRDYPVLTDYRALLGGLIRQLYGLDDASLNRVFAGVTPKDLQLV